LEELLVITDHGAEAEEEVAKEGEAGGMDTTTEATITTAETEVTSMMFILLKPVAL
jgi:hypothetical protein